MELLMIYKISPSPSLPKRGKERENFPKEGEGKGRNGPLDYAKTPFCGSNLKKEESFYSFLKKWK